MTPTHARQQIARLIELHRTLDDSARKLVSEAGVVHQFITPLLDALGWPVHDPARFKYELHTESGRPDMTLLPEQGGSIFVEAKRFGVIQEPAQARTQLEGVDLDPQAAELATVNLLMRAKADMRASEDLQQRQAHLPLILNQNIKVGNSLIGATADDARLAGHAEALAELRRLTRPASRRRRRCWRCMSAYRSSRISIDCLQPLYMIYSIVKGKSMHFHDDR